MEIKIVLYYDNRNRKVEEKEKIERKNEKQNCSTCLKNSIFFIPLGPLISLAWVACINKL
jgi:hypothetical protein